jgi:hypothetical protein
MFMTFDMFNLFVLGNLLGGLTTAFCLMMYQRRFGQGSDLPLSCSGNGVFVIGNSGNVEVHPALVEDDDEEPEEEETTTETGFRTTDTTN